MSIKRTSTWGLDQYGNSVRLAGTYSDSQSVTFGDNRDAAQIKAEYDKFRDIDRLMRQRHGVRM